MQAVTDRSPLASLVEEVAEKIASAGGLEQALNSELQSEEENSIRTRSAQETNERTPEESTSISCGEKTMKDLLSLEKTTDDREEMDRLLEFVLGNQMDFLNKTEDTPAEIPTTQRDSNESNLVQGIDQTETVTTSSMIMFTPETEKHQQKEQQHQQNPSQPKPEKEIIQDFGVPENHYTVQIIKENDFDERKKQKKGWSKIFKKEKAEVSMFPDCSKSSDKKKKVWSKIWKKHMGDSAQDQEVPNLLYY